LKIVALNIKNIKRIKAVEIVPKDNVVTISGKNAQGKSSILEAIIMALGGASTHIPKPIRNGEQEGEVVVHTEDYYITKHWTANDKYYLKVYPQDKKLRDTYGEVKRPQELLDSLVGKLSFDPLEFIRSKTKTETLKKMVGLDFKDIDTKKAYITEERKRINAKIRDLQAYYKEIPEPELNLPDKQIDTAKLVKELSEAEHLHATYNEYVATEVNLSKQIADLEKQLEELISQREQVRNMKAAYQNLPDIESIKAQISSATETNKKIQQRDMKANLENQIGDLKVLSEQYTQELKDLESEKLDRISGVKFPIEGLSINDEGITYKGFPLEQISQSEQLLVGLSVGAALNPNLKVILIKDASVLDAENMQMLKQWAKDKDYQLWIERVEEDDPDAIIIEDGEIAHTNKIKLDTDAQLTLSQKDDVI